MRDMLDCTAGSLALAVLALSVIGVALAPVLTLIFAPGFLGDPSRITLSIEMIRITSPYIFFISLTAMAGGVLNTFNRFAIPALTPALLNLTLIAATLWLAPRMDKPIVLWPGGPVRRPSATAFSAAVMTAFRGAAAFSLGFRHQAVRRIIKLMGPAVLSASVMQINLLVDTIIASFLVAAPSSWVHFRSLY